MSLCIIHNAEVWVNGRQAAFRPYGYTNFYVELDSWLNYGEDNEISVIARNADQPNSRWYSGAGLYRPVWLHIGPKAYLPPNAVKVRTLSIDPPEVEIRVSTMGSGPVDISVMDGENVLETLTGESDSSVTFQVRLPQAALWSPENPKLYTCRALFDEDK